MADNREKISTGPDESPVDETIAGTGPGIPDDALAPARSCPSRQPTRKSPRRRSAWARLVPKKTRFRSKVNESRPWRTADSVIVQLRSLSRVP